MDPSPGSRAAIRRVPQARSPARQPAPCAARGAGRSRARFRAKAAHRHGVRASFLRPGARADFRSRLPRPRRRVASLEAGEQLIGADDSQLPAPRLECRPPSLERSGLLGTMGVDGVARDSVLECRPPRALRGTGCSGGLEELRARRALEHDAPPELALFGIGQTPRQRGVLELPLEVPRLQPSAEIEDPGSRPYLASRSAVRALDGVDSAAASSALGASTMRPAAAASINREGTAAA